MPRAPKSNWVASVASEKQKLYRLDYTFINGRESYYYVLVSPVREKDFLDNIRRDNGIDLADYGTVVASGYDDPPEYVLIHLREKFGATI